MSKRAFIFTQANSSPFAGLDGSVTFSNGTQTADKILLISADGLGAPALSTQTQNAPFQQGASLIRTLFQPRTITLECAISVPAASSSGRAEVTTIKRRLSKYLSPVGMGFLPDTSLTLSNYSTWIGKLSYASNGTTFDRFIDCVPMTVEFPNAFYQDGFQKMRVVFFCPDPFWYGADQTQTMANVSLAISGIWASIAWSPTLRLFCSPEYGTTRIQTSPDGINWTLHNTAGAAGAQWYVTVWSPELALFCSIATTNTAIQTSPDGLVWTLRTGVSAVAWVSLAWSSKLSLFCAVAVSSTNIQTSPDGINWTLRTGVSSVSWFSVCWSEELNIFCAIAQSSTNIQTSPDGINWTLRTGASSAQWYSMTWAAGLGLFCVCGTNAIQTSPDGINWTLRTSASSAEYRRVKWAPELGLLCSFAANSSTAIQTSPDGITWTLRAGSGSINRFDMVWANSIGMFCIVANSAGQYPEISYDGINWVQNSATTDWYATINNQGDISATFAITIPIVGGETGKVVAIGENFLWAGSGDPPSDHNIVFSTQGLKTGSVILNTKFGSKTITQFGNSVMNNFVGGTFFALYVSGSQSNILYLRNTGTPAAAPSITYRNRYIDV